MYIIYKTSRCSRGGFGHCFCNFLTCLIISKLYNLKFTFDEFNVNRKNQRNLNLGNPYNNWTTFLNLRKLIDINYEENYFKDKNEIIIGKNCYAYFEFEFLDNIFKNTIVENYFTIKNEQRIYIFDLFYNQLNIFLINYKYLLQNLYFLLYLLYLQKM